MALVETMTILHTLAAFAQGGLTGVQSSQRDWSPYVVHFTNWAAMAPLRSAVNTGATPLVIRQMLDQADAQSFNIATAIATSRSLRASSPSVTDSIAPCVCLSECNIAGLISHSERFGRFGFVFSKASLLALGGGPCIYLSQAEYTVVAAAFRHSASVDAQHVFSRANVYSPPGMGKIQDFTHEREWRVFDSIDLSTTRPCLLLAPDAFCSRMEALFPGTPTIPLDKLFEWGA